MAGHYGAAVRIGVYQRDVTAGLVVNDESGPAEGSDGLVG